jgi:IclR family transcriptional regulator, KDG regulon repressor
VYTPAVPAVEQACRILLGLAENQKRMKLSQISKQVQIHRSRVHAILQTLVLFGFVERDAWAKTYSLGPALSFLGRNFLDNLSYPTIVEPFLEILAGETNAAAIFGLISGDHLLVVAKHEGNQNVGFTLRVGHRVPVILGAHGKAILAFMSEEERKTILSSKELRLFDGRTVRVEKKQLMEELTRCRELGFARDVGEVTPGVNVVSAPVFGVGEKLIGCITLFGTFPQRLIDVFGPKVAEVGRQVSYKIGAHPREAP